MHDGLPKNKLRFKSNKRVYSTGRLPKVTADGTAQSRAPKRKRPLSSCDSGLSTLTPDVTTKDCTCKGCVSTNRGNKMFICESVQSELSKPSEKSRQKCKPREKTAPKMKSGEASSGKYDIRKKIEFDVEVGSNVKKRIEVTQTVENTPESCYFNQIDTAGTDSSVTVDIRETEPKNRPSTPNEPFNKFPEIASWFEDSSTSDEESVASECTNPRQEVDEYYMFLKNQGSSHMRFLTLKHTLSICYMGLLYTQQNILLSDFAR